MQYKLHVSLILYAVTIFGWVDGNIACFESLAENVTDHTSYRLPSGIKPISYVLRLNMSEVPDFSYQGKVEVRMNISEPTRKIVLHNEGLIIQEKLSHCFQNIETMLLLIPIANQRYDVDKQFFIVELGKQLNPGTFTLELHFTGQVQDDVFGFYRSSYVHDGRLNWMGVTQFSPTYARRAFPCMDEPHLKAEFTLHIGHSKNQTATSNTPIDRIITTGINENYYITIFQRTPKISTYLVGWVVHEFIPETSVSSKVFKMWTRSSMNLRGSTALNKGEAVYSSLKEWFQVDNPISKMDQFAVPDFNFHAMENWGLITYRESVVLHEEHETPTKYIIDGLTTMTHEYAHTWFGNLVTPKFWNVVWLKEGFASYFQYYGLSLVEPNWRMMEKFVVETLQPTLLADSIDHNRTMNGREVGSPSSIMSALDFVSYRKGASVIRMLGQIFGEKGFQAALRNYLENMAYKAADPLDLYKHLQNELNRSDQSQANNVPIKDIAESWTDQPGYPVLTIKRNYKTQTVLVSQERFYQNRSQSTKELKEPRWWIPLNFATKSVTTDFLRTAPRDWLRPQNKSLIVGSFRSEDWVIFNVQQVGYYRVNYDNINWRMLIDYLGTKDFEKIHPTNRAALLDDAFNLARAGYIDYSIPFNLSRYLAQEVVYEPWVAATNNLKFLNEILSSVPAVHRAFQEYAVRLLEPMYEQLSFNESLHEDVTTKLHRELILSVSCLVNNGHCLRTSRTLFGSWISTPDTKILQDVKSFVYCEGIRNGSEKDWYTMWKRFKYTDLHTEQELLLNALGCTQYSNIIDEYLNSSILSEIDIRKQYRITIINAVLNGNPRNVMNTLEFVRSNFQKIIDLRGYDFLSKIITAIGCKTITKVQAEKLSIFVNERIGQLGKAISAAKQAITASVYNVEWIKEYSPKISRWLNQRIAVMT